MSWTVRRGHIVQHKNNPKTGKSVHLFDKNYLDADDQLVTPIRYDGVDRNGKNVKYIAYKYVIPQNPNTDLYLVPIKHEILSPSTTAADDGDEDEDEDDGDKSNAEYRRRYVKVQYDPSITDRNVMWDNFVHINKMETHVLPVKPCKHSGTCTNFTGVTLPPNSNYWDVPSYFRSTKTIPIESGVGEFVEKPVGVSNKISLMKEYLKEQHSIRRNYVRIKTQRAPIPQIIGAESFNTTDTEETRKRRESIKLLLSQAATIPPKTRSSSLEDLPTRTAVKDAVKDVRGNAGVMTRDVASKGAAAAKDVASKSVVVAKDVTSKGVVVAKDVASKGVVVAKDVASKSVEVGKQVAEVVTPIVIDTVKGAVKEGVKGGIEGGATAFARSITDGRQITAQQVAVKTGVGVATGAMGGAVKGGSTAAIESTSEQIRNQKEKRLDLAQSKALKVQREGSSSVVPLDPVILNELALDTEEQAKVNDIKRTRKEFLRNYVSETDLSNKPTFIDVGDLETNLTKIGYPYDTIGRSLDDIRSQKQESLPQDVYSPPPPPPPDSLVTSTTTTTTTTTTTNKPKEQIIADYLKKYEQATNKPSDSGGTITPTTKDLPPSSGSKIAMTGDLDTDSQASTDSIPEDESTESVYETTESNNFKNPENDGTVSNLEHWQWVMSNRDQNGYYKPSRPVKPEEVIASEDEGFPYIGIPPVGSKFFPPNVPVRTTPNRPIETVANQPNPQFLRVASMINSNFTDDNSYDSSSMIGCNYHPDYSDYFTDHNGDDVQMKHISKGHAVIKIGVEMDPSGTKVAAPVIRQDVLCAAYGLGQNCLNRMQRDYEIQLAAYEAALAERERQIKAIELNNNLVLQQQQAEAVGAQRDIIQSQIEDLGNLRFEDPVYY